MREIPALASPASEKNETGVPENHALSAAGKRENPALGIASMRERLIHMREKYNGHAEKPRIGHNMPAGKMKRPFGKIPHSANMQRDEMRLKERANDLHMMKIRDTISPVSLICSVPLISEACLVDCKIVPSV